MGLLGMIEATIEDLDIPTVLRGNLTQSDGDVVLSTCQGIRVVDKHGNRG